MKVNIYQNKSDRRKVDKTSYLNRIRDFDNVTLKEDTSIMDINLIFEVANFYEMAQLANVNYVGLPELQSYYFINDIKYLGGRRVQLTCHEDLLYTYKDQILQLTCVLKRQESLYNRYIVDEKYKIYTYPRTQTFRFPNSLDKSNSSYYLVMAGGAA